MPGRTDANAPGDGAGKAATPVAPPAAGRDKLTEKQLAKAVLAGDFRPRVGEVRRLAEAVLKKSVPKASRKGKAKAKGKKAKNGKLARIPQKKK